MIGLSSEIPLVSHTDVTSPFPPSGNEGYTCNRDVRKRERDAASKCFGNALARPRFEACVKSQTSSDKLLMLKTIFLHAISSLKRIGDLQALAVSCLEFARAWLGSFLYPRPGYVPKVPTSSQGPVVLQTFCPPPFQEAGQERLSLLCPVRALDAYVHRAA